MGVVAATLFELTDIAEWADSSDTEASDSGIETPGVPSKEQAHSTNNDAKQSSDESVEASAKILKCISCDEPDEYLHPLMKECHSCWQKRRGNMPDIAKGLMNELCDPEDAEGFTPFMPFLERMCKNDVA